MEKLSERIGLYDLWVVFFPGIVGMFEQLFFIGTFWSVYCGHSLLATLNWIAPNSMSTWIVIIILSFFLGIVLQEIGRWLRNVTKYKSAMDGLLNPCAGVFTEKERACFRSVLQKYGWNGENAEGSKEIFHRINVEAQECGVAARYAKLNVLQSMSLSLSSAMLLGAIGALAMLVFGLINGRVHIALFMTAILVVNIVLMIVFFSRFKRFDRYWVRNIVYAMSTKNAEVEKKDNGKAEGH